RATPSLPTPRSSDLTSAGLSHHRATTDTRHGRNNPSPVRPMGSSQIGTVHATRTGHSHHHSGFQLDHRRPRSLSTRSVLHRRFQDRKSTRLNSSHVS